ncbi:unnamed protein product [Rhizoctonia solani]|uniref:BTB domain-containing protein n=1 Tax=Rhizoctonia solani TaxID=456999 RepID=A0A8H3CWV7_9AGAM|nr:unnamed protein product [Rhizoctonia solani]
MEYEPKYTVVLRGQEFVLTKSQIEFDSPNYFTACFLGDFQEAQTKRLELSRNPDLFKLIVEYLCGYEILPLDDKSVPSSMPLEAGLRNLRADALFYQLKGLVKSCDNMAQSHGRSIPSNKLFMAIGYTVGFPIMTDDDPSKIMLDRLHLLKYAMTPEKSWTTIVTPGKLARMGELQLPEAFIDFEGLQIVSGIEILAREVVGDYYQKGWKLIGWRFQPTDIHPGGHKTEVLIVLEDMRCNCKQSFQ